MNVHVVSEESVRRVNGLYDAMREMSSGPDRLHDDREAIRGGGLNLCTSKEVAVAMRIRA